MYRKSAKYSEQTKTLIKNELMYALSQIDEDYNKAKWERHHTTAEIVARSPMALSGYTSAILTRQLNELATYGVVTKSKYNGLNAYAFSHTDPEVELEEEEGWIARSIREGAFIPAPTHDNDDWDECGYDDCIRIPLLQSEKEKYGRA